ncbi:hypothetical protein [Frigoriglobus tundricola]|uniref:Zinc finger/thioredoxin putative domain-containing protein n=1 Tax=Frigoriglobus tundricola TaxID=2774151 RepID=A0A6M5YR49_9BACT|nr:hypothetical protein [Frigoriglobus tundricola]QJW95721.1 hypothetical protein FTUN_3275 [Frigoriglobus tundricola]
MTLLKTRCPECNAPLKSAAGFTVGQTICCPKCETYFTVADPEAAGEGEEPEKTSGSKGKGATATRKPLRASAEDDEDDEYEKPKKKKKRRVDDDEDDEPTRSYKNSPLRYAILGVLIVTMLVLGYFYVQKVRKQREEDSANASDNTPADPPVVRPNVPPGFPPPPPGGPNGPGGFNRPGPRLPNPAGAGPKLPNPGGPAPKLPNPTRPGTGGGAPGNAPSVGMFGDPAPNSPEAKKLIEKFKDVLVGKKWVANLGDGVTQELAYETNGTFTTSLSGPEPVTVSGKYTIRQAVGTKGLKIQLDTTVGPQTITVIFEDDEIQHPTLQPGVTGTFRKK